MNCGGMIIHWPAGVNCVHACLADMDQIRACLAGYMILGRFAVSDMEPLGRCVASDKSHA